MITRFQKAAAGKSQTTRDALIDAILAEQLSDGGWNVSETELTRI